MAETVETNHRAGDLVSEAYSVEHPYRGPVRGIVFDWAGTVVDYGSMAPISALVHAFAKMGIEVTMEQARADMGREKRDHIRAMMAEPKLRTDWAAKFGAEPTEKDLDEFYENFLPGQKDVIPNHVDPIPGIVETLEELRGMGLRFGTSTGYNREITEYMAGLVEPKGVRFDTVICAGDVHAGRPAPWMCFLNAQRLNIYPMSAMVKVGDTPVDMEEGRNAGMWTIAPLVGGNEVGLARADFEALGEEDRDRLMADARARLEAAGAHYVVTSVRDVPATIRDINRRLAAGERP